MFCRKCGNLLEDDWVKCPYCGAEVRKRENENNEQNITIESENEPGKSSSVDSRTSNIQQRSFASYLGLSLITLGVYSIYFWYKYVKDVNEVCEEDGKKSPNYFVVLLLSYVTCGIYGIYWWYTQGERLYKAGQRYEVPVREKGSTILLWMLAGVVTGGAGVFIAQYILVDNLNFIVLKNNGEGDISDKNHPHLVRNASIAVIACLAIFISLLLFVPAEDISEDISKDHNNVSETEEIIDEIRDLSSIDMESMIGKTKEQMEKEGFLIPEDDVMAYNGDTAVSYGDDETVTTIVIQGDKEIAPTFHGVALGDMKEEASQKLGDAYTYFEDAGEKGFVRVDTDTGGCVSCLCENEEVNSIVFLILSEEELQDLKVEIEDADNAGTYIFPDSDKRYLSEAEVRSVSVDQMLIGRNEIFARHGRMFDMPELAEYFSQQPWYQGTIPAAQFDSSVLNDFEKKNVELIKRIEDEINGGSTSSGFNPNDYSNLMSLWASGTIPGDGTKIYITGLVSGHTGGYIYLRPHQLVPDMFVYYDNSKYTPVDGTEITVYGIFYGEVVNGQYSMEGQYFY